MKLPWYFWVVVVLTVFLLSAVGAEAGSYVIRIKNNDTSSRQFSWSIRTYRTFTGAPGSVGFSSGTWGATTTVSAGATVTIVSFSGLPSESGWFRLEGLAVSGNNLIPTFAKNTADVPIVSGETGGASWTIESYYPSPAPTPTPTPPSTVTGDVGEGTNGKAGLYVDTDGDGVFEKVGAMDIEDGTIDPFTVDSAWEGKPYQIKLDYLLIDGNKVPVGELLHSGTFVGDVDFEKPVVPEGMGSVDGVVVDPAGNVSQGGGVSRTSVTIDGQTKTVYSYMQSGGGTKSVVYNAAGQSDGVKTQDLREATAILGAAIEKQTGDLIEAMSTPTPGPTPTPEPTPSNLTADEAIAAAAARLADLPTGEDEVAGFVAATSPGSSDELAGGGSWEVPWFGTTINLNPMAIDGMSSLAVWVRNLLVILATAHAIFAAYKFLFTFQGYESLQPYGTTLGLKANVESMILASSATFGTAGVIILVAVWVVFFAICSFVATSFLAVLVSLPSVVSGTLSFTSHGAASAVTGFSLGGANVMQNIWNHLETAPGWLGRLLWLLNQFVPLAHFLVVAANLLTMNAWGVVLLRVIATIKRMIPS